MRLALKATLASISGEATARAIYEVARGFADLALAYFDPSGKHAAAANMHFTAAALYGSIAGITAGIGAAIPGQRTGTGAQPVAIATSEGTASGVVVGGQAGRFAQGGVVVNVNVNGPVYGGKQGLVELSNHISEAVRRGHADLTSSRTLRAATKTGG